MSFSACSYIICLVSYISSLMRINIFRCGDALEAKSQLSRLWMADLGGSERLLKTGAKGVTLDEGRAINLSLSALADVIAALKRKRCHVPYRQVLCWCRFGMFNYILLAATCDLCLKLLVTAEMSPFYCF